MKLILYVHDLQLEIGHSNAMIETIRNFPPGTLREICFVTYQSGDLKKLFPNFEGKMRDVKVPGGRLRPYLLKILFFHLYTFVYNLFYVDETWKKVSIGTASFCVKYINIQFLQSHWSEYYFQLNKLKWYSYIYKKIHFFYNNFLEAYLLNSSNTYVSVLADFEKEYIKKKFSIPVKNIITNYSSVNLARFKLTSSSRKEIFTELSLTHPEIKTLDIRKPIYLFVGAYQRKGLGRILDLLKPGHQIIIVGKGESHLSMSFPDDVIIVKIPFSKQIEKFYSLCDAFLFPSIYEPFGLVILEAAAMGIPLFLAEKNIGACELLHELEGVTMYKNQESFKIPEIDIMTKEKREVYRSQRIKRIEENSWKKCGEKFYKLLRDN